MLKRLLRHKTLILILIPGILLLWKLFLFIDLPYPNFDGPWLLSHAFSILKGDYLVSTFAHDYWLPYQNPPAYGFISAIFFYFLYPLSQMYSIFFYNIILLIFALILSNLYLKRKKIRSYLIRLIIFVSLITTTDIYNQRPELLNINLLLILLILVDIEPIFLTNLRILLISFFSAIVGLVHPVCGMFAVCMVVAVGFKRVFVAGFYVKYFFETTFLIAAIYLPIILLDFGKWYNNFVIFFLTPEGAEAHNFYLPMIYKYFILSPFSFFPYFYLLYLNHYKFRTIILEIGYLLLFLFVLSIWGRYYYLPYIYIFMLWRISTWKLIGLRFNYNVVVVFLIVSPCLTHYIPTISQLLNREYTINFRNIIHYIDSQGYNSIYDKVYLSMPISMPYIKYSNSRFLHGEYPPGEKMYFGKNDIALIINQDFLKVLKFSFTLETAMLDIKEISIPVQEKYPIYLRSKWEDKHVPMGLWEVKLK